MSSTLDPSYKGLFSFFRRKHQHHDSKNLTLTLENLEDRMMLSGSGFDSSFSTFSDLVGDNNVSSDAVYSNNATLPDDEVSASTQVVITSLILNVNGESITIDHSFDTLRLNAGDELQVIGVSYAVHDSINAEGVFSAEGYLNKLTDAPVLSAPDYTDGRFTNRELNQSVVAGDSTMAGLDGGWTVENGTDRLSVALIHYFGDESELKTMFGVRLQVGEPDFVVDPSVADQFVDGLAKPGEAFLVKGSWSNQGDGTYFNYSEVDIFNASTGEVEWVGITVGNTNADSTVSGEYLNTNPNDSFAERWIPTANSDYIIKFFVDPENTWQETNEGNNVVVVKFSVGDDSSGLVAKDDSFSGRFRREFRKLDVIANDEGNGLKIVEYSQGEHGKVRLNKDGTLRYISKKGFLGTDSFTYAVTDAEGNSETATVELKVLGKGIHAEDASGHIKEKVKLNVKLDTERFDAVLVRGVPKPGVELTVGERQDNGWYIVKADQVDDLALVSRRKLDHKKIRFTALKDGNIVKRTTASARVTVVASPKVSELEIIVQDLANRLHKDLESALEKLGKYDNKLSVEAMPGIFDFKFSPDQPSGVSLKLKDGANLESALESGLEFEFKITSVDSKNGKVKHTSVHTEYDLKDALKAVEKHLDSSHKLV